MMMQAGKVKHDIIRLIETRRHHLLHAAYDSGEELFLRTCDSRGVGGVGVLVNTHLAMNVGLYESLSSRIGRLRLKRCDSGPASTVFVAYAPTSDYCDEEVEAFYVELEKFCKEDHIFYKVIADDFNAKIGPRKSPGELYIGTHCLHCSTEHATAGRPKPSIEAHNSRGLPLHDGPDGQFHNEIDHIIFNRKYRLTVVPKFYTGSDHRLLRARFRFSR
ncbi:unnamed protein product [Heligmosomoides polygyrus]|uniref:Endo/exonuclease/phosphatase domain-containing protein n=1 Tax=Heligmosomoides polygyrus TaxID=6339 RepID=A0A183F7Q1_HELPZ|nr:unnamed protein product [Heligmosomoides polygyrus]